MAQTLKRKMSSKLFADIVAIFFILVFCVSGVLTLSKYGVTWDESLGNIFFGERYLRYISSFNDKYLLFDEYLSMHKEHQLDLYKSHMKGSPEEFPALADTASAATMYIFSYKLEWMDPIDGFHLFTVLLVSFFLFIFYFFISKRLGKWVGLFSLFFLGTFPRLWGDMHFNVKDVPEMVFFGLALLAFWSWFEKPSWKGAILVGLAGGAALGVKANAVFLPVIFILGFWSIYPKRLWHHIKSQYAKYAAMLGSGLLTFYFSWPYLYSNPLNVKNYFSYIFSQGGRTETSLAWNWEPLSITSAVIPEIMLFCLLIGIVFSIVQVIRKKGAIHRFALMWLLIPILRISIPPSVNFDGIRHFLEFVPGAALVAGLGAASIISFIGKLNKRLIMSIGIGLFLLISINTVITIKDFGIYQYIYFNKIFGGLPGGKALFGPEEATDYWGSTYRNGIKWLFDHADYESKLYVPIADHIVKLIDSSWLRDDIEEIEANQLTSALSEGKTVYIMFITRPNFYNPIVLDCLATLKPVYEIKVENVPILEIYKR